MSISDSSVDSELQDLFGFEEMQSQIPTEPQPSETEENLSSSEVGATAVVPPFRWIPNNVFPSPFKYPFCGYAYDSVPGNYTYNFVPHGYSSTPAPEGHLGCLDSQTYKEASHEEVKDDSPSTCYNQSPVLTHHNPALKEPASELEARKPPKFDIDQQTRDAIDRERGFQEESSFQALLKASEGYASTENPYQTIQTFALAEPQSFVNIAFQGVSVAEVFLKYDFKEYADYTLQNSWYALYLVHRLNNEAWKRFGDLNFTKENESGLSGAKIANTKFSFYKYHKGDRKTKFPYLYENSSRFKVAEALGVPTSLVTKIEEFIEETADKLCICINGERVPGKHTHKQTWNKKPEKVKRLLYGVAGRALFETLGLNPSVIEYFLKKIACNIAQNNSKRVNKNKGVISCKANKVYRKNSITRSPKKV